MIDWDATLKILGVAAFIGSCLYYSYQAGGFAKSIAVMNKRLESVEQTQKAIASVITTLAVQKVQIERMERDIGDLRRGKGFIHADRETVDGEY